MDEQLAEDRSVGWRERFHPVGRKLQTKPSMDTLADGAEQGDDGRGFHGRNLLGYPTKCKIRSPRTDSYLRCCVYGEVSEPMAPDDVCATCPENLPWSNRENLDRAMRLAPLKLAWEFRTFARKLGWGNPHSRLTTACLKLALARIAEGFVHTSMRTTSASRVLAQRSRGHSPCNFFHARTSSDTRYERKGTPQLLRLV